MLSISSSKDRLFYGWVVVITCLFIMTILVGIRYSFGVFFKSIEGEFELTRTVTSGIFSSYMLLYPATALGGGWVLDRYGPRIIIFLMGIFTVLSLILTSQTSSSWQLFVTYSLLLSIGTGATYTVIMATTARWFDEKRGLALGISGSGSGLGIVVMAPLATYLISDFGWRTAYIVIGLVAGLVIISLSRILRKNPSEIGLLPDGLKNVDSKKMGAQGRRDDTQQDSFSLQQAFRTGSFWFLWMAWLLWSVCLHLVLTHIVPHATDLGISAPEAAIILSLTGGMGILGRLVMGGLSDRIGRKVSAVICSLLQAGAMVWLIWSQHLWMFYLFAGVYGFAHGGFDAPIVALVSDIFGLRSIGVILGVLGFAWGIGAAIGPLVGGFIFDVSNSYSIAFLIVALAMLGATLFVALTKGANKETKLK